MSGFREGLRAAWAERRRARVSASLALFLGFLLWGPGGRAPLLEPVLGSLNPVIGWMICFGAGSGAAAVILAAVVQLVWHLHKPAAEMWKAGFWGLAVGALALQLRSAWSGVLFHWTSNVALDVALREALDSVPPG